MKILVALVKREPARQARIGQVDQVLQVEYIARYKLTRGDHLFSVRGEGHIEEGPLELVYTRNASPVTASHTLAVPSGPTEARYFPSGLKSTLVTVEICPVKLSNYFQ